MRRIRNLMRWRIMILPVIVIVAVLTITYLPLYNTKQVLKHGLLQASLQTFGFVSTSASTVTEERETTIQQRVYGEAKWCQSYFNSSPTASIKHILQIKTTPEVESILYRLGYPNGTTPSGDVYLPPLPDPQLPIPIPKLPVIVTAASSNHFLEWQGVMQTIDSVVRPQHPTIEVIIYDIGFTEKEREQILDYGGCQLRKFNFTKYPEHLKSLRYCAWKPLIIQEALNDYGFIMYIDASIRLKTGNWTGVFQKTRKTGLNLLSYLKQTGFLITNHTYAQTFNYFNVAPCLFHGMSEIGGGFILLVKNNLYSYAVMRAWLTCCLQRTCVIPAGSEVVKSCSGHTYHKCHRYDQSVLGIISGLMYHRSKNIPLIPISMFHIRRGNKVDYFKQRITTVNNRLINASVTNHNKQLPTHHKKTPNHNKQKTTA